MNDAAIKVQSIAKKAMEIICSEISIGMSEKEVAEKAERVLNDLGVQRFWYYDIAALVLESRLWDG